MCVLYYTYIKRFREREIYNRIKSLVNRWKNKSEVKLPEVNDSLIFMFDCFIII